MSVFTDLIVRQTLNTHMLAIGAQGDAVGVRDIDLSTLGISGLVTAPIQVVSGEYSSVPKSVEKDWVEPFLVKSPQTIITPSVRGLSRKAYMYTIWVKVDKEKGVYYNEGLSGMIEQHFPNNLHLENNGILLTVLKTYQQATITIDSNSGRLFNRVFVEGEVYYSNKN